MVLTRGGARKVLQDKQPGCWLPEGLQLEVLECLVRSLELPDVYDIQTFPFRSSASVLVKLMLVCKPWHQYIQHHASLGKRQRLEKMLRTSAYNDYIHFIVGNKSKKSKAKKLPAQLHLPVNLAPPSSTMVSTCTNAAGGAEESCHATHDNTMTAKQLGRRPARQLHMELLGSEWQYVHINVLKHGKWNDAETSSFPKAALILHMSGVTLDDLATVKASVKACPGAFSTHDDKGGFIHVPMLLLWLLMSCDC